VTSVAYHRRVVAWFWMVGVVDGGAGCSLPLVGGGLEQMVGMWNRSWGH
jgi:hypothetical protein